MPRYICLRCPRYKFTKPCKHYRIQQTCTSNNKKGDFMKMPGWIPFGLALFLVVQGEIMATNSEIITIQDHLNDTIRQIGELADGVTDLGKTVTALAQLIRR